MRAVVYARQSKDRIDDQLAVTRQTDACVRLCEDRGWTVVDAVTDNDVSASGKKVRPGFERILRLIDDKAVDVVVCWHVDRFVRKLADLEDVIERCERTGVRLATVSGDIDLSSDAGRLVGRILASVARGEVERKSARQREAQAQAAKAGRRVGGRRPFGYEADGMHVRTREAKAVRRGYEALLSGAPLAEIARTWNAAGLTTGQDGTWRADNVRQVLMNPRNAGLRRYQGEIVGPASWPALVPEETFHASVALLTDPARRNPPGSARALLTGVALCGVCGSPVHGGRSVAHQRTYRCRGSYGHVGRQAEPVDEYVSALVVARLSRPDVADLVVDRDRPDAEALRTEAQALRARLDTLATDFADGSLTASQLRAATERLRMRLREVEGAQAHTSAMDALSVFVGSNGWPAERTWKSLSVARQRVVVDVLMTVRLMPPGRGTRTFRPESVVTSWRQS